MSIPITEALIDAIGQAKGMDDPASEVYRLRNPLGLKSFAAPGKHEIDDEGRRVFPSLEAGYKAAVFDMREKLAGISRAGIRRGDPLHKLLAGGYGIGKAAQDGVVSFLRAALDNDKIDAETPVSAFMTDEDAERVKTERAEHRKRIVQKANN